jgi:cytokinin trans-hydroxylase
MVMVFVLTKSSATYWLRSLIIKNIMAKQGVLGPTPSFLMGNLPEIAKMREDETSKDMSCLNHDIVKRLLPHFVLWSELYGIRHIFNLID